MILTREREKSERKENRCTEGDEEKDGVMSGGKGRLK